MQHWGKVHKDMKAIYEEIATPDAAKAKDSEKSENSAKRVRQAVYDIRYRSRRENVPVARAFSDYMRNTSMSPAERSAVKSNLSGQKEEIDYDYDFSTMQFDEQSGKYKVRVTDKNSGKTYVRYASREKIAQLRSNPNISSVEMTQHGEPYEGSAKSKKLDPVGKEDGDVDNDGDKDKSDKYLMKRRNAIGKAIESQKEELEVHETLMKATLDKMDGVVDEMIDPKGAARMDNAKKKKKVDVFAYDRKLQAQGKLKGKKLPPPPANEEVEVVEKKDNTYLEPDMKKRQSNNEKARKELAKGPQMKNPHFESKDVELPFGDMKKLIKKAANRVDSDVDGDVDEKDKKRSDEMGEYVNTPDGKKKTTRVKEGYSWRDDLIEVMGDKMDDDSKKKIDVMKGKNKIKINPPMGEEVDLSDSLDTIVEGSEKKYCRLCMKKESRNECSYGGRMFDAYSVDDATDGEREAAASQNNGDSGADGGGVSEETTAQDQQLQRKQLQLNRLKLQAQQKALQKKSKTDMNMSTESVFSEFNEVELELISEKIINKVAEDFFQTYVEENEVTEDDIDTLLGEMTLEINESIILTEENDILIEKLGMVKKALKTAGKAVQGGIGLAARSVGTAQRAASRVKSAATSGYKRGRYGSGGSSSSSSPSSSSSSSSSPSKPKGSVAGKLAKGLGKVAKGTVKVAGKVTKSVAGKTARGISNVSGAAAKKLGEESIQEADMTGAPSIKDAKPAKKTKVKNYPGLGIAPTIKKEETEDSLKDRRQERGGVDGNTDYRRPSRNVKTGPVDKKKSSEASKRAFDKVKSDIMKKYGKNALMK